MNRAILEDAAKLSEKTGHVFVATVNPEAVPHVTAAEVLEVMADNCVEITEWFCPVTISNLQTNRSISIVVWDADSDMGYQLHGNMEKLYDEAVVNGEGTRTLNLRIDSGNGAISKSCSRKDL